MSIQINQWLLSIAEATCLGTAVTAVRCCVPSLDPNKANGAVVVWKVICGRVNLRSDDTDVDQVKRTT